MGRRKRNRQNVKAANTHSETKPERSQPPPILLPGSESKTAYDKIIDALKRPWSIAIGLFIGACFLLIDPFLASTDRLKALFKPSIVAITDNGGGAPVPSVLSENSPLSRPTVSEDSANQNESSSRAQFNRGVSLTAQERIEEAKIAYRESITLDNQFACAKNNLGILYLNEGDLNEALALFSDGLAQSPDDPFLHNNIAITYERLNKFQDAIRHYRQSLQLNPRYLTGRSNLGLLQVKLGQTDEGLRNIQATIHADSLFAPGFVDFGVALLVLGKYDEGIQKLKKGAQLDPQSSNGLSALCGGEFKLGRFADAEMNCRKAITVNPRNRNAYINLVNVLFAKAAFADIVQTMNTAIAADPTAHVHYYHRGMALEYLKRPDEALKSFQEGLKHKNNDTGLLEAVSQGLIHKKQFRDVRILLDKSRQELALTEKLYVLNARATFEEHDPEAALALCSQGLAVFPESLELRFLKGVGLHETGKEKEAIEVYQDVLMDSSEYADALFNLGKALWETKQFERAETVLKKFLRLRQQDPSAYVLLAQNFHAQRKYGDAKAAYESAIEYGDTSAIVRFNLACESALLNQHEEAVTWLKKAIDMDGSLRQLAQTELDFSSLRGQEGFQVLVGHP